MKMSECKYCGGDCPEQVEKNGEARAEFICDGYAGDIDGLYKEIKIQIDELSNIRNWDGYGYYKRSEGS
jgi:hypothetical protein